ncbi:MAG: 4Fe-4S binding protein [Clostridiales bacterium]|nr:4Fe-4S binding protein [Clostridiales bacterium]HHX56715.1 4Fe-4S binding protein [Clostridiales bacterium]
MSIAIDKNLCIGCGKCMKVCPGGLLKHDENKKAFIKYPKDCWGCCACIKECNKNAIALYLGADVGGMGSLMYAKEEDSHINWLIKKYDGDIEEIIVSKKESNKY